MVAMSSSVRSPSIPVRLSLVAAVAAVLAVLLAGCPPQNTPQPMPPPPPSDGYQPGPATPPPVPVATSDAGAPDDLEAPVLGATGDACETAADCESGTCEGAGCGDRKGVCAAAARACTKDARPYCGCDGKTFIASGRCPGKRFQYSGECRAQLADGAPCAASSECASGSCEGQGCGAEPTGTCVAKARRCTKDRRAFCGCDGKTFHGSGTCPGARYQATGACP
jgi:hypothetical protein